MWIEAKVQNFNKVGASQWLKLYFTIDFRVTKLEAIDTILRITVFG
jgi:hypothetical protein